MSSMTSKPSLPTGYIELPYVSCNDSCIDTGLRGSYTQTINIKFLLSANSTYYGGIIGAVAPDGVGNYTLRLKHNVFQMFDNQKSITAYPLNEDCEATISRSGLSGTRSYSQNCANNSTPLTMYLGSVHHDGVTPAGMSGRIYYCEIYDNDILVRNYIPVMRESDGVCGFYDTVNGTFNISLVNPFQCLSFTGTATGNFTVNVLNSSGSTVSSKTVTVSGGIFNTELPYLSSGQRYSFKNQTAITSITQCPALKYGGSTVEQAFMGCTGLTSICEINTGGATKLTSLFEGCSSLTRAPWINTSGVKFMNRMFYECSSLTTVPSYDFSSIINSEASSVSSLSSMFGMCESLVNVAGMSGLQKDTSFRGCVNLSVQSLLNVANTVAVNPKSGWSGFSPEIPPTVEGNDSATNYLNIRVSGNAGSTSAGDGSVRVRMYNDDSEKYTEAVTTLANKGWVVNN